MKGRADDHVAADVRSTISTPAEDGDVIVAVSGGSLLNLAQGKFGQFEVDDARWLAAAGTDHGAVIVRTDAKRQTLQELTADLKNDP